jgi:hypothetical protein
MRWLLCSATSVKVDGDDSGRTGSLRREGEETIPGPNIEDAESGEVTETERRPLCGERVWFVVTRWHDAVTEGLSSATRT